MQQPTANIGGTHCVGINDSGVVIVQSSNVLWRGDGLDFESLGEAYSCPSINDAGAIALQRQGATSSERRLIRRNPDGTLATLASNFTTPPLIATSVNSYTPLANTGSAAFVAAATSFQHGIFVAPAGFWVYNPVSHPVFDFFHVPRSINDSNVAVFLANRTDSSGVSRSGIYRGSVVPLVEDGQAVSGGVIRIGAFNPPVINSAGVVAFVGRLDTATTAIHGVYTTEDGVTLTLVGSSPVDRYSLNDSGVVVLRRTTGLYTGGPGFVDRPVIEFGQSLDGSTVATAFVWEESLNNHGQVAFLAWLADGRSGVYRADPVNRPPVAQNGTLQTGEDVQASGTLNASDADGHPLTFTIVSNGTKGVATLTDAATGAFTFAPNPDMNGSDTFTFYASDGKADSNTATVNVTIDAVNDAPAANDGTATVTAGASVSGTLVAADVDNPSLAYAIVDNGEKGTATITNAATGAFTFMANAGATGTDTFTFRATDGILSDDATVTVTISALCATEVTSSLTTTLGSPRVDRRTGHYFQKVTLKNISPDAITGPISFVLDSLTSGTTVVGAEGVTSCVAPAGSPHVMVNVGADGVLTSRERANVSLEFTIEFVSPGGNPITYVPRILAGPGAR